MLVPFAYYLLVQGLDKYWLKNDLRHLYKEILKPYYKRIDDNQCIDYRDLKSELENNKEAPDKSMAHRLRESIEQKDRPFAYPSKQPALPAKDERLNLNLIKRE